MKTSSVKLFNSINASELIKNTDPVIIIAHNLRTPENMGMIMRLAANIGARLTLFAFDEKTEFRESKIKRASSGAMEKISWKIISSDEIADYLPKDYKIVALETSDNSQSIYQFAFPSKTAFLVGNEVTGLPTEILKIANYEIFIPVPGNLYSLNVTHALSVGLFQWLQQVSSNPGSP